MTTSTQDLTGRYVAAGSDCPDLESRRVVRAVFARDNTRAPYDADKRFGIDQADNGSLAALVNVAEEHLEHLATDVSRPATTAPTTGGDFA